MQDYIQRFISQESNRNSLPTCQSKEKRALFDNRDSIIPSLITIQGQRDSQVSQQKLSEAYGIQPLYQKHMRKPYKSKSRNISITNRQNNLQQSLRQIREQIQKRKQNDKLNGLNSTIQFPDGRSQMLFSPRKDWAVKDAQKMLIPPQNYNYHHTLNDSPKEPITPISPFMNTIVQESFKADLQKNSNLFE